MSSQITTPSESELHAVADGGLEPQRLAEVQAWLAKHPGEAARIGAWRAQKEAMHAYFDPILDAPVPAHLLRVVKPDPRLWPRIVGAIACLAIGTAAGYAIHAPMPANFTIATGNTTSTNRTLQQ
ncbi:MAG: anti-sigma factor family protein, partial [Janthinobacterium lividum]